MKPEHDDTHNLPPLGHTTEPLASASEFNNTTDTSKWLTRSIGALAVVGAVGSGLMWAKLSGIQEQLARQSADTGSQAVEARVTSKQAEELARETAARLAVTDAKLSEVSLQRSQLEDLMQSLSRSRDENLVVDIESAIRLAQQQAQLTGSVQPLLAALGREGVLWLLADNDTARGLVATLATERITGWKVNEAVGQPSGCVFHTANIAQVCDASHVVSGVLRSRSCQ